MYTLVINSSKELKLILICKLLLEIKQLFTHFSKHNDMYEKILYFQSITIATFTLIAMSTFSASAARFGSTLDATLVLF